MVNKNKIFYNGSGRDDTLKVIGIIAMAIDHIGLILYPQVVFLRVIGRIAFPVFAWYLSQGYTHTSNLKKYAMRLGIFAIAVQVPYFLVTHENNFNIFFTLLLGLLAIDCFKKRRYFGLFAVIYVSGVVPVDYSIYGILTILIFFIYKENKYKLLGQTINNILGVFLLGPFQGFGLVGSALAIYYPKDLPKIRLNKYFFYFFYPVHLLIIYGISQLPYFTK